MTSPTDSQSTPMTHLHPARTTEEPQPLTMLSRDRWDELFDDDFLAAVAHVPLRRGNEIDRIEIIGLRRRLAVLEAQKEALASGTIRRMTMNSDLTGYCVMADFSLRVSRRYAEFATFDEAFAYLAAPSTETKDG